MRNEDWIQPVLADLRTRSLERRLREYPGAGGKLQIESPDMSEFSKSLDLGMDQLENVAGKVSVVGTFNPAAIAQMLTGGNSAERTAAATERTARNTDRLLDRASTGGLTFS